MNVEELIQRLKKYPPHFEVECWWDGCGESDDLTAEIMGVVNFQPEKVVSLEMATRPLSDGKGQPKRGYGPRDHRGASRVNRPMRKPEPCLCSCFENGTGCSEQASYMVVSPSASKPFYVCRRHVDKYTERGKFEVSLLTWNPNAVKG